MPKAIRPLVAPPEVARAEPLNAASAASVHAAAGAVMARALFMSLLLLLSTRATTRQSPGDLHVRLGGGDREPAVPEHSRDAGCARRLEVAQLVLERRPDFCDVARPA